MAEKVLIVDDDTRLSAMLRDYLSGSGFSVELAATAQSGLTALGRNPPDAVILDVMLPDFDGFETCRRIRAMSDVPILMLTAKGEETDRIVGLELGADDYLPQTLQPARNCSPVSRPSCVAGRVHPHGTGSCALAGSRSIPAHAWRGSTARTAT
jgi:CheY-like chemotaxis protein